MSVLESYSPSLRLLVIQPTSFCNIACKYCYLPAESRNLKNRMSLDTVRAVFHKVFESGWANSTFTVVWHAGEPMVLPIKFYRDAFNAVDEIKPSETQVTHSFQTNGTLVTEEWCHFIKERGIKIGISIDGPREIHDSNRKTRSGQGTFDRVMRSIELLRHHSIDFSVIAVITGKSLENAEKFFDFFADIGASGLSLNPEEVDGANTSSSLKDPLLEQKYRDFVQRVWVRALNTKRLKFMRDIDTMFANIVRPSEVNVLNEQIEPFSLLNVDYNGNFSTFSPEFLGMTHPRYGNFFFGNLNDVSLASAWEHPHFKTLKADIDSGVKKCKSECSYFSVCGGGAPMNKLGENGTFSSSETMFCRLTTKINCDTALNIIENSSIS